MGQIEKSLELKGVNTYSTNHILRCFEEYIVMPKFMEVSEKYPEDLITILREVISPTGSLPQNISNIKEGIKLLNDKGFPEFSYENFMSYYEKWIKHKCSPNFKNKEKKKFYGISHFNQSTRVYFNSKSEFYNHMVSKEKYEGRFYKKNYSIFKGSVGVGNQPIFIKTKYKLEFGEKELFLKELSEGEIEEIILYCKQPFLESLCKIIKVQMEKGGRGEEKVKRDRQELLKDILLREKTFYKLILPVPKEELSLIGNPLKCVLNVLSDNLEKDETLDYVYSSCLLEVDSERINPYDYMRYSPNQIIITNQKVGKSSNSYFITGDVPTEKPTEANLLGYSTSDTKVSGKLDKRTKHTFLEEIQEERGQELFGKLHSYMENGQIEIARGMGVLCVGYSGLTFQGNPKTKKVDNELKDYIMMREFEDFLTKISTNIKPFSSRIGLTLFNKNLKEVKGKGQPTIYRIMGMLILKSLSEGYKNEFTSLFEDEKIIDWLNTPYNREYKDIVNKLVQDCNEDLIKEFLSGQLSSYRHTRGMALRLSFLEYGIPMLWERSKIDTDSFIEGCDEHLKKLQEINLDSYKNILSCLSLSVTEDLLKHSLITITPTYLKYFVYTFFEYLLDNDMNTKIIPTTLFDDFFLLIIREKFEISSKDKYRSWTTIINKINQNQEKINKTISKFGLMYDFKNKSVIIINRIKCEEYLKKYEVTMVTKVTTNLNTEEKVTGYNGHNGYNSQQNDKQSIDSVTNVTRNRLIEEEVIDFIKVTQNGDCVPTDMILEVFQNRFDEDSIINCLDKLKERGEIIQSRPDSWRLM